MGAQGLTGVGVPPQPLWLLYIKIVILVLSLIVLALAGYALSVSGPHPTHPGGLDIFVAILNFIVYGGALALELWAAQYLYRIGALIGYIFTVIFLLSAWAWSASWASIFLSEGAGYKDYMAFGGAMAGAAALGAIVWVLAIVHLAFFIRACVMDTTGAGHAELGQMKAGEVPPQQYQQQYQPVQQPYPAQSQPYDAQQYPPQQYPAQQPYGQQPYPTQ